MTLIFYVHKDDDAVECNIYCKQKYKDQILKYQEDANKYDDLMKANAQVVKDNINITKEHQIVEHLKTLIKSEIQNGKKTIMLARLQTLLREVDYETN